MFKYININVFIYTLFFYRVPGRTFVQRMTSLYGRRSVLHIYISYIHYLCEPMVQASVTSISVFL